MWTASSMRNSARSLDELDRHRFAAQTLRAGITQAEAAIPPNRMLAAFTIKLAAVCAQMLFDLGALQAITNSSRRVGWCSFSASSRFASKTICSASFKFSRASSKVFP
jgi:hypothetical protein